MPQRHVDDGLDPPARHLAVAVLMSGIAMTVLDTSIVNVGLPTIADALGVSAGEAVWVATGYQLSTAAAILACAAIGERKGYRTVYIAGLGVFTAASLFCALSTTLVGLVVMRMLQGLGAAAVMSVSPALFRSVFPQRLLGRALGLSALTVATSAATGPTLGGAILTWLPWPWLFAINVPVGLLAMALATRVLPSNPLRSAPMDWLGALACGTALGAFVVAVSGATRYPPPVAVGLFVLSAAAAGLFVRRMRHHAEPLLPAVLFATPRFRLAAVTSVCAFTAQGLAYVALPFLFQSVHGQSALVSGLLFTPWALAIMVTAPLAGSLSDRVFPPILATLGLTLLVAGLASLALLDGPFSPGAVIWRAALCGAGFGLFQSPNNREIMGTLAKRFSGSASAVLAMARTFGQSLGAGIASLVLAVSTVPLESPSASTSTMAELVSMALWAAVAVGGAAVVVSVSRLRGNRPWAVP